MIFPESILMVGEQFICFNVLGKLFVNKVFYTLYSITSNSIHYNVTL